MKHLKENLNQFQLIKRMLDDLELRDDERLFLNKQYYSLRNKIEIAEEETSDEEDGVGNEEEDDIDDDGVENDADEAKDAGDIDDGVENEADEAKDDSTEDADNVDDDEKKRRLKILSNRRKIRELRRNLFKRKQTF